MGELEDRINSILSDPSQMAEISKLAQSLMGGGGEAPAGDESAPGGLGELARSLLGGGEETPAPDPALLQRLLRGAEGSGRQQALLEAMKPYLSERRREKMDRAIKLARVARIARLAMGEGDGEHV